MRQHPLLAFATAATTIPLTLFGALGNAGAASTKHSSTHLGQVVAAIPLQWDRVHKRPHSKVSHHRVTHVERPQLIALRADARVKASVSRHLFVPLGGVWSALRSCESGGDYTANTGNGYYGAYQFALSTWRGLRLGGLPSSASPAIQDAAAVRLQKLEGWGPWPNCSWVLGLSS